MSESTLVRRLGFKESFSLVVGSVIGTGIFIKTAGMLSLTGSMSLVIWAWVLAGFISLLGAFCYAELGARFPQAGGEYVYLREAYGPLVSFLYGWMRFWIGAPGSIAAYGVGAATFLASVINFESWGVPRSSVAIATIILFSGVNCLSVKTSGGLQSFMTFLKIFIVVGFSGALFGVGQGQWGLQTQVLHESGLSEFGAAMLAALWAYDGWNNMPMAAGEIRDPQKNIPRALVGGMLGILVLYLLANLAYFYVLSPEQVAASYSRNNPEALPVAAKAAEISLGANGVWFLSLVFVFSALGSMTGSILTGARVPYAMAKDRLFFETLSRIHPRTNTPVISVLVQGLIACLLAFSGTFDQLTDYVVFASWIFYALATYALFIFRKKDREHQQEHQREAYSSQHQNDNRRELQKEHPEVYRGFRVPFYPWLPLFFVTSSAVLLLNTLWSTPVESLIGLGIILAGIPFFHWFNKKTLRP